ncbi:MAG: peptide deformylase [Gammaproteobacteria bacterium]
MAIRNILRIGHPDLLQISTQVREFNSTDLDKLIEDMWDTMRQENGVGLAAPQIGVHQRVVIFGDVGHSHHPVAPEVPPTILINPHITPLTDITDEQWEGCLSVPGMRGLVPRYTHIRYSGFDPLGNRFEQEASDFHARVVQHECDHLDGILYPQRMTDLTAFGFREELEQSGRMPAQPCDD